MSRMSGDEVVVDVLPIAYAFENKVCDMHPH